MRYEVLIDGVYTTVECATNDFNEAWECFLNTDPTFGAVIMFDGNEEIAVKA